MESCYLILINYICGVVLKKIEHDNSFQVNYEKGLGEKIT